MTAVLLTVVMAIWLVRLTAHVVAGDLLHAARNPVDPVDTMAEELVQSVEHMLFQGTSDDVRVQPHVIRWEQEMRNAS